MAKGTEYRLTEKEIAEIESGIAPEEIGMKQILVIPNEKEQTLTVGRLGTDDTLELTKREAEVLAAIILHQIRK